jgi:hypothetical protein
MQHNRLAIWRKVAAQVSAFAEDFCKQIRAHFSIFACLLQKVTFAPSMPLLRPVSVPLFSKNPLSTCWGFPGMGYRACPHQPHHRYKTHRFPAEIISHAVAVFPFLSELPRCRRSPSLSVACSCRTRVLSTLQIPHEADNAGCWGYSPAVVDQRSEADHDRRADRVTPLPALPSSF